MRKGVLWGAAVVFATVANAWAGKVRKGSRMCWAAGFGGRLGIGPVLLTATRGL